MSGRPATKAFARLCREFAKIPVLEFNDVPLVAWNCNPGQPLKWDPVWRPIDDDTARPDRIGAVYFGSLKGETKIGFSCDPLERMHTQKLKPILMIAVAQLKHERAVHDFLAVDRQHGEWFSGPLVERFIAAAHMRTPARALNWIVTRGWNGYFEKRIAEIAFGRRSAA